MPLFKAKFAVKEDYIMSSTICAVSQGLDHSFPNRDVGAFQSVSTLATSGVQ